MYVKFLRLKGIYFWHRLIYNITVGGFVKSGLTDEQVEQLVSDIGSLNGHLAFGHHWSIKKSGATLRKYRDTRGVSGIEAIINHGGDEKYFYSLSPRSQSAKRAAELAELSRRNRK